MSNINDTSVIVTHVFLPSFTNKYIHLISAIRNKKKLVQISQRECQTAWHLIFCAFKRKSSWFGT